MKKLLIGILLMGAASVSASESLTVKLNLAKYSCNNHNGGYSWIKSSCLEKALDTEFLQNNEVDVIIEKLCDLGDNGYSWNYSSCIKNMFEYRKRGFNAFTFTENIECVDNNGQRLDIDYLEPRDVGSAHFKFKTENGDTTIFRAEEGSHNTIKFSQSGVSGTLNLKTLVNTMELSLVKNGFLSKLASFAFGKNNETHYFCHKAI